jgi:hypothetical protein
VILRRQRLSFWLWVMAQCESAGLDESAAYMFAVRRAMRCNRWGWKYNEETSCKN